MSGNTNTEDIIDPESWTQKELIKHLYREMKAIKVEQNKQFDKISERQDEMHKTLKLLEDDFNKRKGVYAFGAALVGFLGGLVTKLLNL